MADKVKGMPEARFYETLEVMGGAPADCVDGYYPTVQEMEDHGCSRDPGKYLALIAYFAHDPYRRAKMPEARHPEYIETVKYCRALIPKVKLLDDPVAQEPAPQGAVAPG